MSDLLQEQSSSQTPQLLSACLEAATHSYQLVYFRPQNICPALSHPLVPLFWGENIV